MGLRILLALLLCAVAAPLRAQGPLLYEQFGQNDGLPVPNLPALAQDTAGFLWVGTEGGLLRYDGRTFRPYRAVADDPNALSAAFVHALHAAPDGRIWVGTYGGGLDRYDPLSDRFEHFVARGGPAGDVSRVRALARAHAGGVWAGTGSGLVFRTTPEGERRDPMAAPPGLRDDEVSTVLDEGKALWIGRNSGLYRVVNGRQERLNLPGPVYALLRTRDARLLVGTASGLWDVTHGTARPVRAAPGGVPATSAAVFALASSDDGAVWVGSHPGPSRLAAQDSVYHLDPNAAADDATTSALLAARIRTLFVDDRGTLWIGTEQHGLFKRNVPRIAYVGEKLLPDPVVTAFVEHPAGILWVGTARGLARYDVAKQQGRLVAEGRLTGSVRGLGVLPGGDLLVGTREDGLWRVTPKTGEAARFVPTAGPVVRRILGVSAGPNGSLWLASPEDGVCALLRSGRTMCVKAGLPSPAYTTYWDRQGRLWMSFWGGGLVRYDPRTRSVRRYQHRENVAGALPANNVSTLRNAPDGTLWVGTYGGGFARFREADETFDVVDERHGVPSPIVYGIVPLGEALWLSTSRGLARYLPSGGAIRLFDRRDGLQGDDFNAHAALLLASGQMAFGGSGGFNLVDPARLDATLGPPKVRLTALRVRNRPYAGALAALTRLRLPMRENFLTFEFAALDFSAPTRNRYAYRLDGLEDRWSPPSATPIATYTDLRPGRYTLRVRAAGANGVWRDDALVLPVEIVPPFWRTRWFQALLLVAAMGAVAYGARSVSTRRLRAQMAALDAERRVQSERVRISRDLHDHVGAQLASVISVADLLRHHAKTGDGEEIDRYALALDQDARETMLQLRRTIWATSSDRVSVLALYEQLDQYARHLMRFRTHPRLRVRLDDEAASLPASDRTLRPVYGLHLLRIAQEAISNALKHSGAATLDVRVVLDDEALTLDVRDDGTFKPPATSGPVMGEGGPSGFGLGGMRARAAEMGAALDAGPHPDGGTHVTVRLPLERDAARADPASVLAVARPMPASHGQAPA